MMELQITNTYRLPGRQSQQGFTIIEMMIAIGIGMVLIYTAVVGLRVASQSITLCNRLSLENAIIRAGMTEAHNQLDFWTNLDDPDDPTSQLLRATVGVGNSGVGKYLGELKMQQTVGMAFTPMNAVFPSNKHLRTGAVLATTVPRFKSGTGPDIIKAPFIPLKPPSIISPINWLKESDSDVGFDPTYAWSPHDPRTWYRGNCLEKENSNPGAQPDPPAQPKPPLPPIPIPPPISGLAQIPQRIMGRYNIFSNTEEGVEQTFYTFKQIARYYKDISVKYDASYQSDPNYMPHRWYARQLLGLTRAIGFYGLCDYLPANAMYGINTTNKFSNISKGGQARYFLPGKGFVGSGMMGVPTLGLYSLTVTQSYGVMNPAERAVTDVDLAMEYYRYFDSDYSARSGGGKDRLQEFIEKTITLEPLMELSPETWPTVTVGTAHYIKSAKYVNISKISWTNPLSGNTAELSFTGIGSSLRGARMQRKPGGGWAEWDNATNAVNDDHLDTP